MGHSGPFDERARRNHDYRTRRDRETDLRRCGGQRRRRHLGQGRILRRRRSVDAGGHEPQIHRAAQGQGRGGCQPDAVRREPQILAGVPGHRNLRQAMGCRDQRTGARRRVRTHAVVPLSRRRRESEDPSWPSGSKGRPFPGRGRDPARAAYRAATGRDATFAEGRGRQSRKGQGVETGRRRRSRRRSHQIGEGLDQGWRQGGRALG